MSPVRPDDGPEVCTGGLALSMAWVHASAAVKLVRCEPDDARWVGGKLDVGTDVEPELWIVGSYDPVVGDVVGVGAPAFDDGGDPVFVVDGYRVANEVAAVVGYVVDNDFLELLNRILGSACHCIRKPDASKGAGF